MSDPLAHAAECPHAVEPTAAYDDEVCLCRGIDERGHGVTAIPLDLGDAASPLELDRLSALRRQRAQAGAEPVGERCGDLSRLERLRRAVDADDDRAGKPGTVIGGPSDEHGTGRLVQHRGGHASEQDPGRSAAAMRSDRCSPSA